MQRILVCTQDERFDFVLGILAKLLCPSNVQALEFPKSQMNQSTIRTLIKNNPPQTLLVLCGGWGQDVNLRCIGPWIHFVACTPTSKPCEDVCQILKANKQSTLFEHFNEALTTLEPLSRLPFLTDLVRQQPDIAATCKLMLQQTIQ